jgi:hypothetical protein
MITDSENNMMNKIFSLPWIGERRFLLFLLLLVNLQMGQAMGTEETVSSDFPEQTTIFILDDAVVSGMEHIYISGSEKQKSEKKSKKKTSVTRNRKKLQKEQPVSSAAQHINKTVAIFWRNTASDTSLLESTGIAKQVVAPVQYRIKFFLLQPENDILILTYLLSILLIPIYRNYWFSNLRFYRNFNRPPPSSFPI